jgi:hypothetical protein
MAAGGPQLAGRCTVRRQYACGDFVDAIYNRQWLPSALAYPSPMEFEGRQLAAS